MFSIDNLFQTMDTVVLENSFQSKFIRNWMLPIETSMEQIKPRFIITYGTGDRDKSTLITW